MPHVTSKDLIYREYLNREQSFRHLHYDEEMYPYQLMQEGDERAVEESQRVFWNSGTTAHLVDDPVQNQKYLCVSSITVATRAAIEKGMNEEDALNASDLYIQRFDACKSVAEVLDVHKEMMAFFTHRMAQIRKAQTFSRPVVRVRDYVYLHLHDRITVEEIADHIGLNPSYLSTLFKKETGTTITDYIQDRRVECAENLLRFSDYSFAEIANITAFSSQSYFNTVFKKKTGMTPLAYRKKYYRKGLLRRSDTGDVGKEDGDGAGEKPSGEE